MYSFSADPAGLSPAAENATTIPAKIVARIFIGFLSFRIGRDSPLFLRTVERRIERSLVDVEHCLRDPLNPLRDPPAVHRLDLQRLQNQHVERALK
jgi:hypothetical protein